MYCNRSHCHNHATACRKMVFFFPGESFTSSTSSSFSSDFLLFSTFHLASSNFFFFFLIFPPHALNNKSTHKTERIIPNALSFILIISLFLFFFKSLSYVIFWFYLICFFFYYFSIHPRLLNGLFSLMVYQVYHYFSLIIQAFSSCRSQHSSFLPKTKGSTGPFVMLGNRKTGQKAFALCSVSIT